MMLLPKISIVTPSYNQRSYLAQTMRSVMCQRYPNLEYIVMDGGSNDGSAEYIESVGDRLAHWQSAPDGGQAEAVAEGFKHTSGEICAWLNSDDLLAPGTLQFVADYFEQHPEVEMLYSNRVFINEHNTVNAYWILPKHSDWLMSHWDLIPQETAFWRRSFMDRVGGVDPSFKFALDYDLFARFMQQGKVVRVPRFLGAFRLHDLSKTVNQLNTTGMEEIHRVHIQYDIRFSTKCKYIGPAFSKGTQLRSNIYARRQKKMPGARPGIGWNYDRDLWGGILSHTDFPARLV